MAAVDVGGPAWLVSTTSSVEVRVGPHSAVTMCWPRATEILSRMLKLPSGPATVFPAGVESTSNCTGLFGVHP